MAQKTDIRLRRSDTAGKIPTSANLSDGELAINTSSGAIYFKKSDGTIITAHDNTILHIDSDTTGSSTTGTNPKVGIGTTSPQDLLHLSADSPVLRLTNTSDSGKSSIEFWDNQSGTSQAGEVFFDDGGNLFGLQGNANGIVFKASNTFPGSELMRLTSAGRLGIGTSSPERLLHIDGSSGLLINDSATNSATKTAFIPINNVGNSQLKIKGGNYIHSVVYETSWNDFEYASLVSSYNTSDSRFDLKKSASDGSTAAITRISTGTSYFNGDVGIGTTSPSFPLHVATDGNTIAKYETSLTSDLAIQLSNSQGSMFFGLGGGEEFAVATDGDLNGSNNLFVIKQDGKVGIGTTSPSGELHVVGTSGGNGDVYVGRTSGAEIHTQAQSALGVFGTSSNHDLAFKTNGTQRMRIDTSGNVGIGTTSPAKKLEVDFTGDTVGARFTRSDTTGSSTIEFANSAGVKSTIGFNAGTNKFDIKHNAAVRLSVDNNGAVTFNEAFTFPTTDGTSGQVLKTNGSGTITWADETGGGSSSTSITDADLDTKIQVEESADEDVIRFDVAGSEIATMTDDGVILNNGYNFEGDVVGAIKFKAQAGEALTKGDVVYISGISGNTTVVSKADANDSAKMPAFGLAASTVSLNAAVEIVTFGTLLGIDTSTPNYSEGDELYVSTTAGELTDTAPTGSGSLLQKIAKVTRVDASAGSVKVSGAGRTNATPNLDEGRLFVGNSSNQSVQSDDTLYVDMANSRVGINTTNPTYKLHVGGSGKSYLPGGIQLDSTNRIDFGNGNQYITGANDTSLTLATNGSASLTVLDNGNVGIGTTTPSRQLSVQTSSATSMSLVAGTTSLAYYTLGDANDDNYAQIILDNSTNILQIQNGGGTVIANRGITLDSSENVGIGTSSPGARLQVNGSTSDTSATGFIVRNSSGNSLFSVRNDGRIDIPEGNVNITNNLTVTGNLTVDGTTTTLNTATLDVEDKNITLNYSTGDSSGSANGAGITIQDAVDASTDATFNWNATNDRWELSHSLNFQDGDPILWGGNSIVQHTGTYTYIGDNSASNSLRLTGGNLGIGTNPVSLLDLGTGNAAGDGLSFGSTSTELRRANSGNNLQMAHWGSVSMIIDSDGNDTTRFFNIMHGTNDSATATELFRVQENGNVGIGTTSPAGNLHIKSIGNVGDALLIVEADADNNVESDNPRIELRQDNNLVSGALYLEGNAAETATNSLQNTLLLDAKGASSDGGTIQFATGGLAANQSGGPTNSSVRMTILRDGNVGIGDTSPSSKLHVVGAVQNLSNQDYGIAAFENTDLEGLTIGYDADGNHSFMYSREVGVGSRGLRLNGSIYISSYDNNVGIGTGTNALTNKLDVNGTISAIGGLRMGSQTSGEGILRSGGATGQGVGITTGSFSSASIRLFVAHPNDGGGVGIGTTTPLAKLQVEEYGIDTTETSTTATTQVAIHTFAATDFRSARFTIQASNSTDSTYHISEILLVHDGTTPTITEYGTIFTGSAAEATFDADISSGNVRLLATPASTDSIEFKVICHSVTV